MKTAFKLLVCLVLLTNFICAIKAQVSVTNANTTADFATQINAVYPGAVTLSGGVYTLQNFTPQVTINGYVWLGQGLNLINCPNITLAANAYMEIVASNITLYIENSTLRASGTTMWDRLFIDNSGGSRSGSQIKVYNSTIKDANRAIVVNNSSATTYASYDVFNTTFDKNYISIEADYGNSTVHSPGTIKKSRFYCTSTLLSPFSGQVSTAGVVGFGVSNLIVGNLVETNQANFNIFEGIACGVFSFWSTTTVYASKFNNILQCNTTLIPMAFQENYNGVGVYQRGLYYNWIGGTPDPTQPDQYASSTLNIPSVTAQCRFNNCFRGIELHNTHATVNGTSMTNMEYGILVQNCNTASVNITGNSMDPVKYGMYFGLNNNSNVAVTSSNSINMISPYGVVGPSHYGIRVVDWPSYNGHYVIFGNNITGGSIGIRMENANNTSSIRHNSVLQQSINTNSLLTSNVYGIQVVNCSNTNVLENSVTGYTGTWNSLYHQTGIYINSSPGTVVRCNQTQTTGYGIWVHGNSTATDLMENNAMTNHYYGLYLSKLSSAYGRVGDQGTVSDFNGNEFLGSYTGTYKTFNLSDASQNPSTTDIFWYDPAHNTMYSTNFSNSNPTGKPVRSFPIPSSYSIPAACPVYFMMGGGGSGGNSSINDASIEAEEAIAIAGETKTYTEFSEVSKWLDERRLYEALDGMVSSNSVLNNFYYDKASESVGRLKDYNNALEELALATDSTTYQQKLKLAKQKNNEVPATYSYEQNEKDMNEIFLNNLLTNGLDKFDATQTSRILSLAQSCPFADGRAVYLARALYSLIEPAVIFDDAPICESMGYYKKERESNAVDTRREKYAYISPNPTGATANLFLNLDEQETGELVLRDLLGNVVLRQGIVADKTVQILNLQPLASGTYLYSVQTANGFSTTGKLVVIN